MFDADVILNGSDRTKSEQHIMQEAVVSCAVFAGLKDSVGQSITPIHATDRARMWAHNRKLTKHKKIKYRERQIHDRQTGKVG